MSTHLAVDVGATNTRALVADGDLTVRCRVSGKTEQGPTASAFVEGVQRVVREAMADADVAPETVDSVGVASFGPLDVETGRIVKAANVDVDLRDVPLVAGVREVVPDTPVGLINDAAAGAIAEHRAGAAENVVYLTLSSGIGAGVVVDGQLLHGGSGNAAEVGHFTLEPDSDRACGCGSFGHWEAFASGENIPEYAAELRGELDATSSLPERSSLTAAAVFDAYGRDPLATAVVDRTTTWNVLGVANTVHAFAPERVAIGGALALNNEGLVVDRIRDRIDDHLMIPKPEIHATTFGERAVIRGALLHATEMTE